MLSMGALTLFAAGSAWAQPPDPPPEIPLIEPAWRSAQDWLKNKADLDLKLAYTGLFMLKSESRGIDEAGGGDFDIDLRWRLLKDDMGEALGTLVAQAETRHRYLDIPPSRLGSELGSNWAVVEGYSIQDLTMAQLFWQQRLPGKKLTLMVGKINQKHHLIRTGLTSDAEFFLNRAFSQNPAVAFPSNPLGGIARLTPGDRWFAAMGVFDANGRKTTAGFDSLFNDGELIWYGELGLTPDVEGLGKGTYRLSYWNQEARASKGIGSGWGLALSADQELGQGVLAVLNAALNEGELQGTSEMVSVGLGFPKPLGREGDYSGLGAGWGSPDDSRFRDQWIAEAFYRVRVMRSVWLTPDLQLIINPSRNRDDDVVGVFGLRFRVVF
jgi:carbohydrate-selective porin OprB